MNTTDYVTTGTATVTEDDSSDVTKLLVSVTDNCGGSEGYYLTTRAYDDPAGEFDADCFDVNTFAEDIAEAIAMVGWRPTEPITVADDGTVTFAVEKF